MLPLLAKAKFAILPVLLAALMFLAVVAPAAAAGPIHNVAAPGSGETVIMHYPSYAIGYTTMQTLTVNLDTSSLFTGAQLIIDALSSPYLLIAGLGLGVSILGAILAAVTRLRL